ncbi:HAD-IIIC family phosphatase [Flavobacterium pallidum]|uniref:BF1531-like N-terminal domain-containing protein n=1 Tax=Flavobacterium pallidum TaxID=2172098 RepID=A0A2S1SGY0_9FLAO|nr:HAD-IIIC family phosphatase [Flavobacterium pallidum]AWI25668.1 hypothetical protein HYN49_07015 [Flavobacterium pallidum]
MKPDYKHLKSNLKKDFTGFPIRRLAVLGDSPTQLLAIALKGYGYESRVNYDIFEADFNQIEMQALHPASSLYQFNPDVVVVFFSSESLFSSYCNLEPDSKSGLAQNFIEKIYNITDTITEHSNATVIVVNFCTINDGIFGNYANKTQSSFLFQLRKLNYELMLAATVRPKLFIADFDLLQSAYGFDARRKESVYINTGIITDIDFTPHLASSIHDTINAMSGKFRKCVILDLDNTLWGGIIGDDGIVNIQIGNLGIGKAYYQLQQWLKELSRRGIILAVCSKNDETIAKSVFTDHPEMVLRLKDISVFMANWDNKADNIRQIQAVLNIGFDSMVFLDDNPFERNLVAKELPAVLVPGLPEDPAQWLPFLQRMNLFETVSYDKLDAERTSKYQEEAKRVTSKSKFTDEDDYLKSLQMEAEIMPFTSFSIPRMAQLSQRSNQYNLTTIRYDVQDLVKITENPDYDTLSVSLKDIYGDYGLVSMVVLKKQSGTLRIESWLMSCRVMSRGVEKIVMNEIVRLAASRKLDVITGEYIPTEKNHLVADHYKKLGFSGSDQQWEMRTAQFKELKTFISQKDA